MSATPQRGLEEAADPAGPWRWAGAMDAGYRNCPGRVDKADRLIVQIISDGPAAKKSAGWVPAAKAEANKRLVLASTRLYRVLENLTARILKSPIPRLDASLLADAQAVLAEAAPRTIPVPVSRGPAKKA